jgi:hypothetical protein
VQAVDLQNKWDELCTGSPNGQRKLKLNAKGKQKSKQKNKRATLRKQIDKVQAEIARCGHAFPGVSISLGIPYQF